MLKHNLLLIFRNFKRFKSTFIINLIGLSTGLACTLLIFLWVSDELQVDKFHENDSRLFQVMENSAQADGIKTQPATPDLLGEALAKELPEVEYAVSVTPYKWFGNFTLIADEINVKATGQYASKEFFKAFSYPVLEGDKNKVLEDKNAIVVSEELAINLFKTTKNAIGKTLNCQILGIQQPVIITGIFNGIPSNSTEQFDFVMSYEAWKDLSLKVGRPIHWDNHGPNTFLVLNKDANIEAFNKKIAGFLKSKSKNSNVDLFVVPFSNQYLYGTYHNGLQAGGRIDYVILFSVIALFILGIACINFMNLSTAKASRRVKEVGIKKAIGANRRALITQYLSESISMAFLSLALAVILVEVFLPQFNLITGKQLALSPSPVFMAIILGVTLFTGVVAGSYPALYLSGFNPAAVLKGKLNTSISELIARKGLVVFQFVLSIILIVSVLVVYKQIEFVQTKNLGYDKDHIIYFDKEGKVAENQEAFYSEAKNIPGVANISSIVTTLMGPNSSTQGVSWEGKNPDDAIQFENVNVSYDMIETLGVEVLGGRTFSRDFKTDDHALIFNEAAIAVMGIKDPVGKTVNLWGENMTIIGVVKNFHFESLHERVKPLFFLLDPSKTLKIMARLEAGKEKQALSQLGKLYTKFNPGYAFTYQFLDQDYQAQYVSEKRIATLSQYFAGLAILISCLGLFGLAAFTAEKRIKEIGIRKILGSSELSIVYLLSNDFTKIVFTAIVIALLISYFMASQWLGSFAFKIELQWWYFAGAGLLALMIAWFTVGSQALRAAKANPVKSLRSE
jgi:ABC-type antimicrobial peptide transport system permease subunit